MSTALTGAAGEHYVAYRLSMMGYCVGLSRGGSPFVDIMLSNSTGDGVAIQVKTSNGARREYKRKSDNNRWEFDVGKKAETLGGPRLFYAFVDIKWDVDFPDVFVVPSADVRKAFAGTSYPRNIFWIMDGMKDQYFERWDLIADCLQS